MSTGEINEEAAKKAASSLLIKAASSRRPLSGEIPEKSHFYNKEMIIDDVAEYATAIDADGEIWAYDDVVVATNTDASTLVFVLVLLSFCFPVLGLIKEAKAEQPQQ